MPLMAIGDAAAAPSMTMCGTDADVLTPMSASRAIIASSTACWLSMNLA